MVKLDLTPEAMDSLMVNLIQDGYENCYWSYRQDSKKFKPDDGLPKHWVDTFDIYETTLRAFENLMDYYGGSQLTLKEIRDRIDYGDKIIRGMSGRL